MIIVWGWPILSKLSEIKFLANWTIKHFIEAAESESERSLNGWTGIRLACRMGTRKKHLRPPLLRLGSYLICSLYGFSSLICLYLFVSVWLRWIRFILLGNYFGDCLSLTPRFALLTHYEEGSDTKHVIAIVYIQHWFRSSLFINILCSVFQVERPKIYNKIFSKSKIWYWPNLAYAKNRTDIH